MQKDGFEWDDAKAAANYVAHGVRFEDARDVFRIHSPLSRWMIVKTMARSALRLSAWWRTACCSLPTP
jgi:uncharacterized DUF497 family protein